jgi:outer membrane protein insertion porin family
MVTAVTWTLVAIPRRSRIRVFLLTRCCTLCFLPWTAVSLQASADDYEGKTVASILFDPARQPLAYDQLTAMLAVKTGQPLRSSDVRVSIQRLYGTGEYTDIAVDASLKDGNVDLRFITKPAYFIGYIGAEGVPEPPNHGQIITAAKLQLGVEFSPNDVTQGVESIGELLKRNGFFNPLIDARTQTREDVQQVDVDFQINPGKRARFGGLDITGKTERPVSGILSSTGWKGFRGMFTWRPVTYNRVQAGLENVRSWYLKHDFLMSKVTIAAFPYNPETNRVVPTLDIVPGPLIDVKVFGARISKGRLRSLLPIYQERTVDDDLLREGNRDLIDYFQSLGYFEADASFTASTAPSGDRTIDYSVVKGGRHKLVLLDITGNKYFSTATLRERMFLTPASFLRFPAGRYSREYRDRDINSILDLYRANGFRDVQVTSRQIDDYEGKKDQIAVFFDITEGPQRFVSTLRISGVTPEDEKRLRGILHSTEGQPYSESNVASDRDTILQFYYDNGYPEAAFEFTSKAGADPNQVELDILVTPGRRVYVRSVVVNGLHTTKPDLVSKRISVNGGDPLSQSQITESQRRLYDLGIFARVDTAIQNPDGDEPAKDVLYALEEAHRYSMTYGFGAEIARIGGGTLSLDRPAGATGFSPRVTIGISRLNFLGLGHTATLQTLVSTLEQRALFTYLIPQLENNRNLNLQFSGFFDISKDVRTFSARREEGSVQLGQRLSKANSAQYRFVYRKVNILGTPLVTPELIPLLSQPVRVGLISSTFIHDTRDDPIDAHRGIYNTIDLGVASSAFGSQTGFVRLIARNATYHRLTGKLILARNTYFGDISRYAGLADIPLAERFFSGGSSSQRAFPDLQAGPRDPITGFPIGGNALFINTVELRFPLIGENIGGVLFNDMGNVYSSIDNISLRWRQRDLKDFDYAVQAFGFGIRYRTPIGPVRVDLSLSPNSPRFFGYSGTYQQLIFGTGTPVTQRINVFQFHFSLGQQF